MHAAAQVRETYGGVRGWQPPAWPAIRSPRAALSRQDLAACLGILGRRLLNVCVKFSEDEVESGVRSTSADTLSDQPLSEWPAGREADRTLAQRTAAIGLTDRGSLSDFAPMTDRPLRLADDDVSDLGGLRRSLTGTTAALPSGLLGGLAKQ